MLTAGIGISGWISLSSYNGGNVGKSVTFLVGTTTSKKAIFDFFDINADSEAAEAYYRLFSKRDVVEVYSVFEYLSGRLAKSGRELQVLDRYTAALTLIEQTLFTPKLFNKIAENFGLGNSTVRVRLGRMLVSAEFRD